MPARPIVRFSSAASVVARGLVVVRGGVTVLDGVDLTIGPEDRLGVVGPNGAGKSTLLQALAGRLLSDQGAVTVAPAAATVGYLEQEPERPSGDTVAELIERRLGIAHAANELEASTGALAADKPGAGAQYAAALERWLTLGGADIEARSAEVLADLRLNPALLGQPAATLSGGQAARVALAVVLLSRHDVLLLDEPTNDLDFDGLDRLEAFLARSQGAVVVVSHDRAFLERTITSVVEIDDHAGTVQQFNGGWSAFLEERATARRHAEEAYQQYTAERDRLRDRARQQRQWSQVGVRDARRKATDGDKFMVHHRSQTSEQLASKAKATERAIERLEVVDKPWEGWELRMELAAAPRSGDVVARLDRAVIERDGFRLGPIDLEIGWGERVALTGVNGSGKTTLLHALLGRVPLRSGERWMGPGVVVGELDQARARFSGEATLLQGFVGSVDGVLDTQECRSLLAKFGLGAEHVSRSANQLSPGERTRAGLALLMATGTNCLVLDEPTNHLDLQAIEQLEAAVGTWTGTMVLVTHDRRFLDGVAIDRSIQLGRS